MDMDTIQLTVEIPAKFKVPFASGELWRDGGVLRHTKNGRIACILKDAPILPEAKTAMNHAIELGQNVNASKLIKNHKIMIIISGVVLFTVVVSGVCLYIKKILREKRIQAEKYQKISELQSALTRYVEDATAGKLTLQVIDRLILALDVLDDMEAEDQVQVEFNTQNLRNLVRCILNHTTNTVAARDYVLDNSFADGDCSIINLRNYLNEQKEILKQTS